MVDDLKLLELMSARMVHDLAGPVGAVDNSIEFLEEENEVLKKKATNIVKSSSEEAVLRLKYYRQAYGNLGDNEISSNELKHLLDKFLSKTKIRLEWQEVYHGVVNVLTAKILLNLVVIATSSLIYGGKIIFTLSNDDFIVKFEGENLILSDETQALLNSDSKNISLTSSNVQVYYTSMLIKNKKAKLFIKKEAGVVEFQFKN